MRVCQPSADFVIPFGFAGIQPTKIVFVEDMLGYCIGRPIPPRRVIRNRRRFRAIFVAGGNVMWLQTDRANRARTNIGATPPTTFRPKFATNEKIGMFQRHSSSRLLQGDSQLYFYAFAGSSGSWDSFRAQL